MKIHYDVFLSYQNEDSDLAKEIDQKICKAGLKCFMYDRDTSIADKWEAEIRGAILDATYMLLLITPYSKDSPWLHYEAGAGWIEEKNVIPALRYVKHDDLIDSIKQFQGVVIETPKQIDEFVKTLADSKESLSPELCDVFLAAPMAAYETEEEYQASRSEVMKVYDTLQDKCDFKVYCALSHCPTKKSFEARDVSVKKDLAALSHADYFVLLYPRKITSSVLFEAGYALAQKKRSVYFVSNRNDLPYMMQKAASVYRYVIDHELPCENNLDSVVHAIEINGPAIINPAYVS